MSSTKFLKPLCRIRAFHTSIARSFTIPFLPKIPQKPGGVSGTANDSSYMPPESRAQGSYHWIVERGLSLAVLPLIAVPLVTTGPISTFTDTFLSLVLLGHCHIGFQSCIIDYISERVYGKVHHYAMYLLSLGSFLSFVGIYKLESQEAGLIASLKSLWDNKPVEKKRQ
ncbi:Mitochondrial inner membrane protein shh4 [Saccharomyces cerevisiae]|uniref:Mitochondrial inner membrane protein SHH4 n=2 Tax=Saccharomyces cerevisiae TaxID=4932 RepID=SHH4_YEAST|nr:protein SHH4 [Saccharomyces cerevisiae S288C]Q06236.1 RecName: Full=Mitochondrial inner membrane protein SHH4; AltName: Full=SDH4 homolog; Flags: Precursor [Saccharomyces cerevisiae S288C]AAB67488.1 Ylr164wp [Saccharomyces cerevisiae]AJV46226.1 Shh4p [Saccharomyces cerevisiae YJM1083]AJV47130.1 Shh4p [Saccharomyces cerevisiae YJM1133]AJV48035.1 Shh4p [Saccharomyces cerevisiae YJM1199]AJV48492.1 Shh4p [Saccharomyces cerevisiae YJM1202]AJV48945.1 Shh4p [Saccharomyces cerevisiae YJM1208]AJV|eukprot:NP_013265.1 protein SHH4 [Saccharomyces cerevisiae S288C]